MVYSGRKKSNIRKMSNNSQAAEPRRLISVSVKALVVVVVVVVSGAYTGFLLSLELASLLECRRGPVHTLGKATAGE